MNRRDIEAMCREAGLLPAHKQEIQGVEVLVADGFISPSRQHILERFGIEKDDYPLGCYCTIWWAMKSEEKFAIAQTLFFDWDHEQELTLAERKQARVNAAIRDVDELLGKAREVILNA